MVALTGAGGWLGWRALVHHYWTEGVYTGTAGVEQMPAACVLWGRIALMTNIEPEAEGFGLTRVHTQPSREGVSL